MAHSSGSSGAGGPGEFPVAGSSVEPAGNASPRAAARAGSPRAGVHFRPIHLLLLVPLIGTLIPEIYNRRDPAIGGMPFFYWYQLLWIAISVICTWAVYRSERGQR